MKRRQRIRGLLFVLAVVIAVKLGQQLYSWVAYADERERLQALAERLETTGLQVFQTGVRADSLITRIEQMDQELKAARQGVEAYDRHAVNGAMPAHLYAEYRAKLDAYNRRVEERNALFQTWQRIVERNRAAVSRYQALADSARALAISIREPYFAIPSPVEIAAKRGVFQPEPD